MKAAPPTLHLSLDSPATLTRRYGDIILRIALAHSWRAHVDIITMAFRRSRLLFLLYLGFPPFSSECFFHWASSEWMRQPQPQGFLLSKYRVIVGVVKQLMNAKFFLHLPCLLCILAISVLTILDAFIRLVFWSCNTAVIFATSERFPQKAHVQ